MPGEKMTIGAIAKELLDRKELERRLREEEEELERTRRRKLAENFMLAYYYAKNSEEMYQKYCHVFDKVFDRKFPLASREAFTTFSRHAQKVEKLLSHMDDFDSKFHLDHKTVKGIEFTHNIKTVMTREEKARLKRNTFDQRQLNMIFYAVKVSDPKAEKRVAEDAIYEYSKGNIKPLCNIIGNGIRNTMDKLKKCDNVYDVAAESAIVRDLLEVIELHPDLAVDQTLSKKEMNEAYGAMTKGFLYMRGLESKMILEATRLTGEKLDPLFEEECIDSLIAANIIAKKTDVEQLGTFGFKAEDIKAGIVPKTFIERITSERLSIPRDNIEKEIDNLLVSPLLPEDDEEAIEVKQETKSKVNEKAKEIEAINNHETPVLKNDELLKKLEPEIPVLGGGGGLGF